MLKSESWHRCGPRDTEGGEADRSASSPKGQRPTPTVCVRVGKPAGLSLRTANQQFQNLLGLVAAAWAGLMRCPGVVARTRYVRRIVGD